jgi:NAD(P)-dependent dehydrogenase (short-subunit alcohol dehydrogenase family)
VQADVAKPEEVNNMIGLILDNFGKIDIAVNNAGICFSENAIDADISSWQKILSVNLIGAFLTSQAAGRVMVKNKRGSIINIASMSAQVVCRPQALAIYNSSKAGLVQLTRSMAAEWAKFNVRVNSISPGYIATEMSLNEKNKDLFSGWIESIPMKRMGEPEELQGIALYLASDASTYTTGADIIVDGGFTCW